MNRGAKLAVLIVGVTAVCLVGILVGKDLALAHLAHDASPTPFVIESKSTTFSGSDLTHPTMVYYFFHAVRSDGSQAYGNIALNADGSWHVLFRRVRLVTEGRDMIVGDLLRLKSTTALTEAGLTRLLAPWQQSHGCSMPGYKYVGEGVLLGHHVMKFDRDYSNGHWQEWEAPDLACNSLWGEMQLKNTDGSVKVTTFHTTISVQEGEPSPALFDVSNTYSEVPPSEIVRKGMGEEPTAPQGEPTPAQESLDGKLSKLDQFYAAHRVQ